MEFLFFISLVCLAAGQRWFKVKIDYPSWLYSICRFDNFYIKFLNWKIDKIFFQFDYCFSINFDYFDVNLLIPHISMTPESKLKLTFDFPSSCFFVIVGGKYLNRIGSVMKKVNSITNDIGGTRPMAIYIMSNTNEDDLDIDIDYSFDRVRSTPVMVKLLKS